MTRVRRDQRVRHTIDERAPAPQHTCCHHISRPTATRPRCSPSPPPAHRGYPGRNALGDTSSMTAPPRATATPYTRPAPRHWRFVDLAPHSRCARHTWTHWHPDSARAASLPVASSERDTTRPRALRRRRVRRIDDDARDEGLTDALRRTTCMCPMRCSRTSTHSVSMPPRLGGQPQPGQHRSMAQAARGQTARIADLRDTRLPTARDRGRPRCPLVDRRRSLRLRQPGQPVSRASRRQERRRQPARPDQTAMRGIGGSESLRDPRADSAAVAILIFEHNQKIETEAKSWVDDRIRCR